ncbi:zinc-binding dehydrogenase, partial [Ralstonia pseudosolanacearum]|uniref:zinc-binding dehydrogenase n=1 Tax=Ralstonia pseudosolanacearum TaxID=1310165 RepID=UPI003CE7FE5B
LFSCSTWSEYTVVNVNYLVKIDPKLPKHHASLISCGFSTGFGSVWKEAKIEKGSSVAVFGLGAVGLGVIEGARMMEANKIIGVDLNEWKKDKGEIYGMTEFINPAKYNKPISEVIKDVTGGLGVDYSIECTGVDTLVNQAFESTKMGKGVTIVIGAGPHQSVSINFMSLISGRTIKGCLFGGLKPQSDFPSVVGKLINKEINVDNLVTHTIILDDINEALEILSTHSDCLKVVIEMNNN